MDLLQNLEAEAKTGLTSHAYLFLGGNEESNRKAEEHLIKLFGCLPHDIVRLKNDESNGKSSEIKVEFVRDFIHKLNLTPIGSIKIGIIEQAHKLNQSSANILLKTLEEPPKNVIIILSAKSRDVIPTIKSRCRVYTLNGGIRSNSNTFSYINLLSDNLSLAFKEIERIVKDNEIQNFLLGLELFYEDKMVNTYRNNYAKILEDIILAEKKIKGNANPRLTLENLLLKARNCD